MTIVRDVLGGITRGCGVLLVKLAISAGRRLRISWRQADTSTLSPDGSLAKLKNRVSLALTCVA